MRSGSLPPGRGLSPEPAHTGTDLRLSASSTARNKFLVFTTIFVTAVCLQTSFSAGFKKKVDFQVTQFLLNVRMGMTDSKLFTCGS